MTAVQIEEDIEAPEDIAANERERWARLPHTQLAAKAARKAAIEALGALVNYCTTSTDPRVAALAARYQQCKSTVEWFDHTAGYAGKGLP
jgi:hypothetical protein